MLAPCLLDNTVKIFPWVTAGDQNLQHQNWESEFGGLDWSTGLEQWTTGLEQWTTGMEYWNTGIDLSVARGAARGSTKCQRYRTVTEKLVCVYCTVERRYST